jgi:multiple sugar transport system permease protein
MAPALAVVGIFAFLTAWNEYLYQFILLSSPGDKTVAITLATFFDNEDTPWNYPVAASLIYALPPIALFFAIRRYIAAGLTSGRFRR